MKPKGQRRIEWLGKIEAQIQAIRDRQAGHTRSLNEREALALSGEWYRVVHRAA